VSRVGSVGHSRFVVVSVTVVTDVLMVAVVDGVVGVSVVVVGAALVVGVAVVGGGAPEVEGSAVLSLVGLGSGADDSVAADSVLVGAADVVAVTLLEVTAGLSGLPELVNFTTAYTSSASTAAVSTPKPTSAAGRWCQGGGGGAGPG
jgi:hypothetical protein